MFYSDKMLKIIPGCTNYLKTSVPTLLSHKVDLLSQQTRNTFILKRTTPPGLHKKHAKPHPLKSRHFVYELVEDTNVKKQKEFKVILVKDVKGFGETGDMISVPSMKGYESLILTKSAVYASPENIEKYCLNDVSTEKRLMSPAALTEKFLSTLDLGITMALDNEWTIQKKHIRVSFRKVGVHVPEDAITMPSKPIQGPNLELQGKLFYVTVKINDNVSINVKCRVLHYTNDESRQVLREKEFWKLPCKAIFPEDQELLDSLPVHRLLVKESLASEQAV